MAAISGDWLAPLSAEFRKPYYRKLYETVMREYAARTVYPPPEDLFSAFEFTPLSSVKAVILGQDPYHEEGQAHGLCFSVRPGVEVPPSLANIFRELHDDLDCRIPDNGCLIPWARQGVLLLNTVLTVRAHRAASHRGIGWEEFTDAVIRVLNAQERPIVFLLWGRPAAEKASMLNNPAHLVLTAPHPSPLSAYRGFFGCRHFSRANAFLCEHGVSPVDWQIPDLDRTAE
ncbi:MAG: uracil-DNA glycosylase [Lachnospiraceae bacterium]|nr:uracil-DNA glycosylase [Lachnospiraceae bacterium]